MALDPLPDDAADALTRVEEGIRTRALEACRVDLHALLDVLDTSPQRALCLVESIALRTREQLSALGGMDEQDADSFRARRRDMVFGGPYDQMPPGMAGLPPELSELAKEVLAPGMMVPLLQVRDHARRVGDTASEAWAEDKMREIRGDVPASESTTPPPVPIDT